jgi:ferredoxin-type protein NapH
MPTGYLLREMKKRQLIRKRILLVSVLLFPLLFYYLSPYLIVDGAMHGIITGSFLVFALLFFFSLFFGRAFCGWLCPAGSLQDYCTKVSKKKPNYLKYLIWVPWLGLIIFLLARNGIRSVQPFYQTYYGISISNIYSLILFILIATFIAGTAMLFGKRAFCHCVCWMAPFMIIGRKISNFLRFPALRLKTGPACINCMVCNRNCPMGLDVNSMVKKKNMKNPECILCLNCVDTCPKNAVMLKN